MADHLFIDDTQDVEGKFIGWDYAHAGDYTGYYGDDEVWKDEKKWTTQEIFEEVKDACYQLKQLEEKSSADEMFKELGYEKIENRKDQVFHIEYAKYDEREDKSITIQFWNDESFDKINNFEEVEYITMQELKAINKKVEELRLG